MSSFKTMRDIVDEFIAERAAWVHDPARMEAEHWRSERRVAKRLDTDPAIAIFTARYAQGVAGALSTMSSSQYEAALRKVLVDIIIDWENISRTFEDQLKTTPIT